MQEFNSDGAAAIYLPRLERFAPTYDERTDSYRPWETFPLSPWNFIWKRLCV